MRGRMFFELKPDQHAGYTFPISSVQVITLLISEIPCLKSTKQSTTALQGFLCFYYLYEPINETCLIEIN